MAATLVAVYAPLGLVGGLTGALFSEFAFTLAAAVVVSAIVALTVSPMAASRLLQKGRQVALAKPLKVPREKSWIDMIVCWGKCCATRDQS